MRQIYATVLEMMGEIAKSVKVGNGLDAAPSLGL